MTYQIANEIANGNEKLATALFVTLTKTAIDSGLRMNEAKQEAKVMMNIMVNSFIKTNKKFA